jgi:hypothetical protein
VVAEQIAHRGSQTASIINALGRCLPVSQGCQDSGPFSLWP